MIAGLLFWRGTTRQNYFVMKGHVVTLGAV